MVCRWEIIGEGARLCGCAEEGGGKVACGRGGAQVGLEDFASGVEFGQGIGREAVEDEVGVARRFGELRAEALPPVPAAAGDAAAVGPDDLARFRVLDRWLAVLGGIPGFAPGGDVEDEVAGQAVEVFAADRQQMGEADGVVAIDDAVDRREVAPAQGPVEQRLDRAGKAARLRAERAVDLSPGGDVGQGG